MQWKELLNSNRYAATDQYMKIPDGRNVFERDQDKILFSCSFRRLMHKTQVHPFPNNDHIHNRLSHSLEVASVGRTLGYKVGGYLKRKGLLKNIRITQQDIGNIVEAACLAHDIGNPPFGHSGESAIRRWFFEGNGCSLLNKLISENEITDAQAQDLKCFEGNAQGFRILTQIEYFSFQGGMRLTYVTLAAFLKYPWTSNTKLSENKQKHGCNQSEVNILKTVASNTGLIADSSDGGFRCCRHPLSYLMEAADDICYKIIDLEDGLEMGLINFDEFEKITRIKLLKKRVPEEYKLIPINASNRRKVAVVRSAIVNHLVDKVYKIFITNLDLIMQGDFKSSLIDELKQKDKGFNSFIEDCNNITRDKIFNHSKKIEMEIASHAVVSTLLDTFVPTICKLYFCRKKAVADMKKNSILNTLDDKSKKEYFKSNLKKHIKDDFSFKEKRVLDLIGDNIPDFDNDLYDYIMIIIDYISGMTDRYAMYLANQINGTSS